MNVVHRRVRRAMTYAATEPSSTSPKIAPAVMITLLRMLIGMLLRPVVVSTSTKALKSSEDGGATALVVSASWSVFSDVTIRM